MTIKAEEREALLASLRSKDVKLVREILGNGFDPNEKDSNGSTAFHEAVSTGSSSITLAFLRRGAKTDLKDRNGNTPLHISAQRGHTKIVQMLLDNNADISLQNFDGKTAEELSTAACKELLQRKRVEVMMKSDKGKFTKSFQDGSLYKMNPERCSSPYMSPGSQKAPSLIDKQSPNPGEVKLSFEYSKVKTCLKVNILEVKDLKLPAVNNYSHVYVKCRIVPDKDKETKGKTSLFKIDSSMDDQGYVSRSSSASSQSSTASTSSLDFDTQIADKIMSVLKKRPHLHKKNKNEVKCFVNQSNDFTGRVSVSINESLSYDGLVLRKHNNSFAQSQLHVRVCGKNRFTHSGATIAEAFVPLAVAMKNTEMPMSFYLDYKIEVPVTPDEKRCVQLNQSWELKQDGQCTGRGLAWSMGLEQDTPATLAKAPSVPDMSSKRQRRYHSKAARFLKGDLKFFKSKPNERYNKNSKHQDSISKDSAETNDQLAENSSCSDEVQYIGREKAESCSDQVQYIGRESKSLSKQSDYGQWNSKSIDNIFQVTQIIDEPSTISRPSLKYSRAFGNQSSIGGARKTQEQDVSIEDVDDDFSQDFAQSKVKARTKPPRL